jgi:hypothetical protein
VERNEGNSTAEELSEADMYEDALLITTAVLCSFFREQFELNSVLCSKFCELSSVFIKFVTEQGTEPKFSVLLTRELSSDFKKEEFSVLLMLQLL